MVDAGAQQAMRLVVTVALTRLLAPEAFGLLAMALVFTQLASMLGDLGLGPALIQKADLQRKHVTTAFTVTAIVGVILAALFAGLSFPVAAFYEHEEVQPVLAALAVTYLLRGFVGVPRDLLRRAMDFKGLALVSLTAVASGGVVGIVMAVSGAGVWALVGQVLVEGVVSTLGVLLAARRNPMSRPAFGFDSDALRDLAHFGIFVTGTRLAYYATTNADNLVVGKVLGAASLGLYNLAYRLMLLPILKVADVVATVSMPAMATIQNDTPRLRQAVQRAIGHIGLVCFPVSVGFAVVAPALVPAVFGDRWLGAVVCVQILALNGVRLAIGRMNGTVYEATGRPAWDLGVLSFSLIVYVLAFLTGVKWGIEGVAWAYTLAGYALLPLDQYLVGRALGASTFTTLRRLLPVMGATLVMAVCGWVIMELTADALGNVSRTLLVVGVSALTYLAALRMLAPQALSSLQRDLLRRSG